MAAFVNIYMSAEWADRMWDTFGFDYLKGSSPIIAWPLDDGPRGMCELVEALLSVGVEHEVWEGDPEVVFS